MANSIGNSSNPYNMLIINNNITFLKHDFMPLFQNKTMDESCTSPSVQHVLFQLANICFMISYLAPNGKYCILFMHSVLTIGFLLISFWAWNIICATTI